MQGSKYLLPGQKSGSKVQVLAAKKVLVLEITNQGLSPATN